MTTPTSSSRAEQVRERRRTHTAEPKKTAKPARAGIRGRKAAAPPPVVTRGNRAVMPTRPLRASRTRRMYEVSLGSPGAELRLPAMPTVRFSWRWVSGLFMLGLIAVLYLAWTLPTFQVRAAEISGLRRVSERDVNLVLGLADTPIFILQADVMQKNLMSAFPEFAGATVQLAWPNKVTVTVTERVPVLAWTAGGQTVWVDAQGMSFPVRGEGDATSLVVVEASGPPSAPAPPTDLSVESAWAQPFMSVDLVSAVLLINGFAPAEVTLLYDMEHGLGWRDPQGWQVYFGIDGSDMGQRLQVYQAIVAELTAQQITPALISVEHLHAPYYRMDQ
ncbi:MAG: FtsQ-type POTRA domain-containing protein [Anaerolineales bacterium]|jgi:hypothetical protein|nr:FtsQ-type POTRA domain-containing protein [Anaerolineales bacterium]